MWSKPALSVGPESQPTASPLETKERVAIATMFAAILLGAGLRLGSIEGVFLQGDELHSLKLLEGRYFEILSTYDNRGSGLALPLIQRLAADLFGYNLWTVRLPALLGSLALIGICYPLTAKVVGRSGALTATLFVALNSALIYHGHFARSYSLAALLALVFVSEMQRCANGAHLSARRTWAFALLFAALPFLHLAALSVSLPACAGLAIVLGFDTERRGELRRFIKGVAIGTLATVLLYLPAWSSFWSFVGHKSAKEYAGAFGVLDVVGVLAGSRVGAILFVLLGLSSLAFLTVRRGRVAAPLILACLGPCIALLILRPYGDAYAYSRYALFALPCWFVAFGWSLGEALGAGPRDERRIPLKALTISGLLAVVVFAAGPTGFDRIDAGPYTNSYSSQYRLPAFDIAYPETSQIYEKLGRGAKSVRIIEAPLMTNRSLYLYRNSYLQHGFETRLGFLRPGHVPLPGGAAIDLLDFRWRDSDWADFLVLHRDLPQEVARYWKWVYAMQGETDRDSTVDALMERHSTNWARDWVVLDSELREKLELELGDPIYEDRDVVVWSLRGRAAISDLSAGGHETRIPKALL